MLRSFFGENMLQFKSDEIRNILIVKFSSLGDIVHVTPCLSAIRKAFPRATVSMAVESRFAAAVRHHPCLDEVIEVGNNRPWSHLWAGIKLYCGPSRNFDLAIDFQGSDHSAAFVYLSRARFKVGRGTKRPFWQKVVRPNLERHAIRVCAEILFNLGINVEDLNPSVHVGTEAAASLRRRLDKEKIGDKPFLLINPFSRVESKMWPVENYAELILRLKRQYRLPIVISGASYELSYLRQLVSLLPPGTVHSLVGDLSLDEALSLYQRASLVITGDSGPMHIAAALGTPVVALFGPTLVTRTGPWGENNLVIQKRIPDHHHRYLDDADRQHIRAIGSDDVFEALTQSLDKLGPRAKELFS